MHLFVTGLAGRDYFNILCDCSSGVALNINKLWVLVKTNIQIQFISLGIIDIQAHIEAVIE